MITGFGQFSTDPDTQIKAYIIAADGCRDDAIVSACIRFTQGKVKSHKASRLPTSAEFGQECRSENDLMEARARYKPPLPKPPEPVISAEEKQRVARKMKLLNLAMKGDQLARQKLGWHE